MYRFLIEGETWIVRFSPHISLDQDERHKIVSLLIQLGKKIFGISHGRAFCVFSETMGLLVIEVERIPSLILTISNAVTKENWYIEKDSQIIPFQ
jgi:hypothetical protein